jgi:hypothetical protein
MWKKWYRFVRQYNNYKGINIKKKENKLINTEIKGAKKRE